MQQVMERKSDPFWNERWHLAARPGRRLFEAALASLLIGFIFVLYHRQGNTTDSLLYGRSALRWMVTRWGDGGAADYSHGWLIPLVSATVIWWKRRELIRAPKQVCQTGLAVVVLALLSHWLGAKTQQTRLSLVSLVLLLWGIPFYLYGKAVARLLLFPCAYLLFCIPLSFLDSLTVPLRLYMTTGTCALLNGLGVEYVCSGTALYSVRGGFGLEVADPCSGIHSLMAMTAITAIYAYLTQRTLLKQWTLFLAAIPLAMVGNMVRIITIALVSEGFGEKLGAGLYHEASGYLIFLVITIPLMLLAGQLLNLNYREFWYKWKYALLSPTSS